MAWQLDPSRPRTGLRDGVSPTMSQARLDDPDVARPAVTSFAKNVAAPKAKEGPTAPWAAKVLSRPP